MPREHTTASSSVHYFEGEAQFIRQLQKEGRITICSENDDPLCGLPADAAARLQREADAPLVDAEEEEVDEDLGDGGPAEPEEDEENEEARNFMLEQSTVATPVDDGHGDQRFPGTARAELYQMPSSVREGEVQQQQQQQQQYAEALSDAQRQVHTYNELL